MMYFKFSPTLLLRCPFFSPSDYHPSRLKDILCDDYFMQAIYFASPGLHQKIKAKTASGTCLAEKEQTTLLKYYNRMSYRPTPFGSFSTFSQVSWGSGESSITLSHPINTKLTVLTDQAVTRTLTSMLLKTNSPKQLYLVNPTLYGAAKEFRYIKIIRDENTGQVSYQLDAYEANSFTRKLLKLLQNRPVNFTELAGFTINHTGCSGAESQEYIHFLINAQIIGPQLGDTVLGNDHLTQLTHHPDTTVTPLSISIASATQKMAAIKLPDYGAVESVANDLTVLFKNNNQQPPKQWFYTGLGRSATGTIATAHQQQISEALIMLRALNPPVQSARLTNFITKFKQRYDRQKIPLLQALDPETGLGYGAAASPFKNELLQDIQLNNGTETKSNSINWSAIHRLLMQKWNNSIAPGKGIILSKNDLCLLDQQHSLPLPPSISVLFSINKHLLILESAGGASALSLIGRFTIFSTEVYQTAKSIAQAEKQQNPNVIFAEINHLCDDHTDNINRRLPVYDYELSLISAATAGGNSRLLLSDLWISVINNELILESVSLQKRVIPRLSSAYNYHRNTLGLYQFLGDLQYQGIHANLSLDLENLFPGLSFYPRVTYLNTILCRAKWLICESDILHFCCKDEYEAAHRVKQWHLDLQLPQFIAISHADQQLVFNMHDELEIKLFIQCIKQNKTAVIHEHPGASNVVKDHRGNGMINQFVASLLSATPSYSNTLPQEAINLMNTERDRDFIPGSKWLYLKIYCATSRANELLLKSVIPLLKQAKQINIKLWFFIRYTDTGPHIRLRFLVANGDINNILTILKNKLSTDISYQLVNEYQADTYRRELERYGPDIIDEVEKCFAASSELVIYYIKLTMAPIFPFSYHSMAIISVMDIINCIFPALADQLCFAQQMANVFYEEHADQKSLKLSLDRKYRELKTEISSLLFSPANYYHGLKLKKYIFKLLIIVEQLAGVSSTLKTNRKTQLLADLIHMHLNRLFPEQQRTQEMIIYHCLFKHLRTVQATSFSQNEIMA